MVVGDTNKELRHKLEEILRDKNYRVTQIGLKLQEEKTKLWVINSDIEEVWYGGRKITPMNSKKDLGCLTQHDLKPNSHVELTLRKIKQSAARIRALGNLPKKLKLSAYHCWAQTALLYDGNTYLPFLISSQLKNYKCHSCHYSCPELSSYDPGT